MTTWTPEHTQTLRRLVASGMTDGQIAERMGKCRQFIQLKRRLANLQPGQSKVMTAVLRRIRTRQHARSK